VIALKLFLVPFFLAAVSFASRRWGPNVGGRLAGLPLVTGPILFILSLERGTEFTAQAATASLSAVVAAVAFGAAYSHACLRMGWLPSFLVALATWCLCAAALAQLPESVWPSLAVALASLVAAPWLFPKSPPLGALRAEPRYELPLRMGVAVLMTLFTTGLAETMGTVWTGLVGMFPVLSSLLAVFCQRAQGAGFAIVILRNLATGLYALTAFCLVIALLLPQLGTALTFTAAILAAALAQWVTRLKKGGSHAKPG
jgi:hypothetical protein